MGPVRIEVNRLSAAAAAAFGVPGFFTPRMPPALFALNGTPQALSIYDTAPLHETLKELIDFKYLNREGRVRLSVGSVNVRTGNSIYFDNLERKLVVEHIMASGSLPPGFPPVLIDGDHYWDGGIVSNSPLSYVLDDSPDVNALIVQVDLFSARGELPANLDQVLEREKDIRYSSKTRFNTKRVQEVENLRLALGRLMREAAGRAARGPRLQAAAARCREATLYHDCPPHQPASVTFHEFEGLRVLPRDGATALGSRRSKTCGAPAPIASGSRRTRSKAASACSIFRASTKGFQHETARQTRAHHGRGKEHREGDRAALRARGRQSRHSDVDGDAAQAAASQDIPGWPPRSPSVNRP